MYKRQVLIRSAKHKIIQTEHIPESMLAESQDFEHMRDPFAMVNEQPLIPYSYAPFFPTMRRSAWCCLVSLQKDNKLIQTPVMVNRLSFQNLSKSFDKRQVKMIGKDIEGFKPEDWVIGTIKIPLGQPAPQQTGTVFFRVVVKSTDYFGSDLDFTMAMHVKEYSENEVDKLLNEGTDIYSDDSEEEDEELEEEEDEDSDSDYTDIDTDTEVEEDAAEDEK